MIISVIIPVYKVEAYLKECVDSVLGQNYKDIEVLLVDDGSPDHCPEICDEYAERDSRVRVIHKENGGLSDARNAGLDMAQGEFVMFLDSDDWWIDNKVLDDIVDLINEHNADVVLFDRITYTSDGKIHYPNTETLKKINDLTFDDAVFELSKHGKFDISAATKVVRAGIIKGNSLRFIKGIYSEDIDWTFALFQFVHSVAGLERPIYCYRKRVGSITASVGMKNIDDHFSLVEKWSDEVKINASYSEKMKRGLLGELCYQYFCANSSLPLIDQKSDFYISFKNRLKKLEWLESYRLNKKTRLAYMVNRILGKKLTRSLLRFYVRTKDKYIKF